MIIIKGIKMARHELNGAPCPPNIAHLVAVRNRQEVATGAARCLVSDPEKFLKVWIQQSGWGEHRCGLTKFELSQRGCSAE